MKESNVITICSAHEAIVDEKLFYKVQECKKEISKNVSERIKNQNINSEEYIFSGLLVEGYNQKPMYKVHYYKNSGKTLVKAYKSPRYFNESGEACKLIQIREDILLSCVESILYQYIDVLNAMTAYLNIEKVKSFYDNKVNRMEHEIDSLKMQLYKSEEFLADSYKDMVDGITKPKNYILFRKKYLNDEKRLHKVIDEKEQEKKELRNAVTLENPYIKHLTKFGEDPSITREFLELLIHKITVNSSTSIDIEFKFKDEYKNLYGLYLEEKRLEAAL